MSEEFSYLAKNVIPGVIEVDRAKGIRFWDKAGKEYLDFSAQSNNLNFGNAPEHVLEAMVKQFGRFSYISSRMRSDVFEALSRKLVEITPSSLVKVNAKFTDGSTAVESALKRVRTAKRKPYVITFHESHHGESCETLHANGKRFTPRTLQFGGSGKFLHTPPPFVVQELQNISESAAEEASLSMLRMLCHGRQDIAAILLDPAMFPAGCHPFTKRFIDETSQLCDEADAALIFDEVQTGFGWTGNMFAADHYGTDPHMMTFGKGIAAGLPLAAVVMREEYDVLEYEEDEFTYGGMPLSCAAALKTIERLEQPGMLEHVKTISTEIAKAIKFLRTRYADIVTNVRSLGVMAGLDFCSSDPHAAHTIYGLALKRGLLTRLAANERNSLALKPPLIATQDDVHAARDLLGESLDEYRTLYA